MIIKSHSFEDLRNTIRFYIGYNISVGHCWCKAYFKCSPVGIIRVNSKSIGNTKHDGIS